MVNMTRPVLVKQRVPVHAWKKSGRNRGRHEPDCRGTECSAEISLVITTESWNDGQGGGEGIWDDESER